MNLNPHVKKWPNRDNKRRENAVMDNSGRVNKRRKRPPRFDGGRRERRETTETVTFQVEKVLLEDEEYVWKQPRGEPQGRWHRVSGEDVAEPGELLSYAGSGLVIVVRPNLDWLPVSLTWNEHSDFFEGFDQLDQMCKLEVASDSITEMISDPIQKRGQGRMERYYRT